MTTDDIRRRIYEVVPAASFHMHKILSLTEIVLTDTVPTAAVDVGARSRLSLNPTFVEQYCASDEHLFLLVMHELHHVILGHTRLFPRVTRAHNIAFDALINATLAKQFREPEFDGFFEVLNPWAAFPSRLLRPPPSWRANGGRILESDLVGIPEREQDIIRRLYGTGSEQVTFQEILDLLKDRAEQAWAEIEPFLLGDHSPEANDEQARIAEGVMESLGEVLREWGKPYRPPGDGEASKAFDLPFTKLTRQRYRHALEDFLRKAGAYDSASGATHRVIRTQPRDIETVLPQWRDRRIPAFTTLWGSTPLIQRGTIEETRPRQQPFARAHVYLDISGSMLDILPELAGALHRPWKQGHCRLFTFSTVVDEVLRKGSQPTPVQNTFGTLIQCVFEHVLDLPRAERPRRIAIVTDGMVGDLAQTIEWKLESVDLQVHVALTPPYHERDVKPYADRIVHLPPRN